MGRDNRGQALLEYLFVFALFSGIALGMARGIGNYSTEVFRSFAFALSRELSVGSCPSNCWHYPYKNSYQGGE